jgi:hypothetical protein
VVAEVEGLGGEDLVDAAAVRVVSLKGSMDAGRREEDEQLSRQREKSKRLNLLLLHLSRRSPVLPDRSLRLKDRSAIDILLLLRRSTSSSSRRILVRVETSLESQAMLLVRDYLLEFTVQTAVHVEPDGGR